MFLDICVVALCNLGFTICSSYIEHVWPHLTYMKDKDLPKHQQPLKNRRYSRMVTVIKPNKQFLAAKTIFAELLTYNINNLSHFFQFFRANVRAMSKSEVK